MATPLVAGLVALLLSQSLADNHPITAPEMKALLQAHSQPVQIETACNCRISAEHTMKAVLESTLTVVPNAGTYATNDTAKFSAFGGHAPFQFTSSNPAVLSISEQGELKALADGSATIKVTDSDGHTAQSHEIYVGKTKSEPPGGGGDGKCPFDDAQLCDIFCQIVPTAPWCKSLGLGDRQVITTL
jgi:thermitase